MANALSRKLKIVFNETDALGKIKKKTNTQYFIDRDAGKDKVYDLASKLCDAWDVELVKASIVTDRSVHPEDVIFDKDPVVQED